jgi:hypothetical protein
MSKAEDYKKDPAALAEVLIETQAPTQVAAGETIKDLLKAEETRKLPRVFIEQPGGGFTS